MGFLVYGVVALGVLALMLVGKKDVVVPNEIGAIKAGPGNLGVLTWAVGRSPQPTLNFPVGSSIAAVLSSNPAVVAPVAPGGFDTNIDTWAVAILAPGVTDLNVVWTPPTGGAPSQTRLHLIATPPAVS